MERAFSPICKAAVTKYYKLSGLSNRRLLLHSSGGQKSEISMSLRLVSSEAMGKSYSTPPFP
jgi:hypothetical protein